MDRAWRLIERYYSKGSTVDVWRDKTWVMVKIFRGEYGEDKVRSQN